MDGGDVVGDEEVLEVHDAGDGEPAFDAGGAAEVRGLAVGFVVADPEDELEAEPGVEGEEGELDGVADSLRAVAEDAADEGLFGPGWGYDGESRGDGRLECGGHMRPSDVDSRGWRRRTIGLWSQWTRRGDDRGNGRWVWVWMRVWMRVWELW